MFSGKMVGDGTSENGAHQRTVGVRPALETYHPVAVCPRCGGPLVRIRRRWPDKLLSVLYPVKRYRCDAGSCKRVTLVRSQSEFNRRLRPMRRAVVLVLLCLATGFVAWSLVEYMHGSRESVEE